jgi:hypothetical protein
VATSSHVSKDSVTGALGTLGWTAEAPGATINDPYEVAAFKGNNFEING